MTGAGIKIRFLAFGLLFVAALSALALCAQVVWQHWGLFAAICAVILAPITVVTIPWYAGFGLHDWLPLALVYGGGFAAAILNGVGESLQDAEKARAVRI